MAEASRPELSVQEELKAQKILNKELEKQLTQVSRELEQANNSLPEQK